VARWTTVVVVDGVVIGEVIEVTVLPEMAVGDPA
jgi:hypothetical protein